MNIYIEGNDIHSTLTTWIYCSYWQAYAAEKQGHTPYIHWPRFKSLQSLDDPQMFNQKPNMYEWYFEQPYISGRPTVDVVRTWNTDENTGLFPLMGQPLETIREYYHKTLKFNEATNIRGQLLVDIYGIDFSKTIGITWRGTDIFRDGRPRMPIELYYPWIDGILDRHPDFRIACTAEEEHILDPLFARYPNAFLIKEFIQARHGATENPERDSPVSGYDRGLQPALMVWLFSKCAFYIKNRSSTGAVASWISDGKIVSLGHPETLGFPANTDTVEYCGNLYPLNTNDTTGIIR